MKNNKTKNITLQEFHNLLSDSFAVSVDGTLTFVGYTDENTPYVDTDDFRLDLSEVDGDIEVVSFNGGVNNSVYFYVQGEPYEINFLEIAEIY